jgi:4-azaleucine resistance transporter AzlC
MTRRQEFIAGVRDTLPMMLGAIPFGLIFGAQALNAGLSPAAVMGMSLFVFAGSAQFIGALLFGQGASISIVVLTTFIVNLRHALYSASLAPYVKNLSQRWLLPLGFWLTDETYAVTINHFEAAPEAPFRHWYYLGSAVTLYILWNCSTIIGIIAGQNFAGIANLGLDFALVVIFIGIVVPLLRNRPMLVAALVAGLAGTLTYPLPNKIGLMIAALAGIVAGLIAESLKPEQA